MSDDNDEPGSAAGDAPTGPRREPERRPPQPQPDGEIAGPKGPEPTRYGDWEKNGRCTDF